MSDESDDPAGRPTRLRKRSRQTFAPKHGKFRLLWDKRFRAYAIGLGYELAASQARRTAIGNGDIEFPTEPDKSHVDWWQRKVIRDHKAAVRQNSDRAMGWDAKERKRAQWRNSKRKHAALRYQAGEESSLLYNTDRKLMTPEECAAHDRQKRAAAQRERRANARRPKEAPRPKTTDHPNFGRF